MPADLKIAFEIAESGCFDLLLDCMDRVIILPLILQQALSLAVQLLLSRKQLRSALRFASHPWCAVLHQCIRRLCQSPLLCHLRHTCTTFTMRPEHFLLRSALRFASHPWHAILHPVHLQALPEPSALPPGRQAHSAYTSAPALAGRKECAQQMPVLAISSTAAQHVVQSRKEPCQRT